MRRAEQLQRQADRLGEMLGALAERQRQLEAEPASGERQAEAAAELAAAGQQLAQMSAGDGPAKEATSRAAAAAESAAEKFGGNEGRPEDLEETMAAVAEAQKRSLGEAEHAAAVLAEVGRLQGEVQRLSALAKKDPAKLESEAVEEWLAALQKRRAPLQKQLHAAASDQMDDTPRSISQADLAALMLPTGIDRLTPFALDQLAAALDSAQTVLRERLRLLSQRDLLESMQGQAVPREYRELVTAYFLKLSREEADAVGPERRAAEPPVEETRP